MAGNLKYDAALAAFGEVKSGMKLGIGTGSTAEEFVKVLVQAVSEGLEIVGVPTSERTKELCIAGNVPLTTLDETPELDLVIDGADEIDPKMRLIKGGGGAHLREKIVAKAGKKMIVIADESKIVDTLGTFPLPIEVTQFGSKATMLAIEAVAKSLDLSGELKFREKDGQIFVTDEGHYIIDASFGRISKPEELAQALVALPGVVEHGLFIDIAKIAYVASSEGVKIIKQ
jgi:ribose 5-phosphate isomerase A